MFSNSRASRRAGLFEEPGNGNEKTPFSVKPELRKNAKKDCEHNARVNIESLSGIIPVDKGLFKAKD